MTRVVFAAELFSASAFIRLRSLTSSGTIACRAGMLKDQTAPRTNPITTMCQSCIKSVCTRIAVVSAVAAIATCVTITRSRFSTRSATAPPTRERSNKGIPQAMLARPSAVVEPVRSKAR